MSPMTRILFGVGLALVLLACSVDAHGWMTNPKPRGQYRSPARYAYEEYGPATINPNDPNFVCRSDPDMPRANWLNLRAGQSQSITLQFTAPHVGDCFVYLSYDGDKADSNKKWFKIWQQHDCKSSNNYDITIPSYLPSGEHVVFRWEWYALHAYPKVEYYAQCVDAVMSGSSSGVLPQPQVNIPGHLPVLGGDWDSNTNNYWWPYGSQKMRFTGPALATVSGVVPTDAPATPAPTAKATPAPTSAPTAAATPAPTSRPTSAPTPAPTSAPTVPPPTQAPAPATQAPTVRPPIPQPTTRPPAASVKLSVTASASEWWFAVQVVGQRAEEVAKVEVKDSGCVEDYEPMSNDWADVWVFDPNGEALVFPLTVRASLPSGSSITFVVNSLPATTVDSGSVFAY